METRSTCAHRTRIGIRSLLPFPVEEDAGVSYEPGGETCIQSSATRKEGLSSLWPMGLLLDLAFRQLDPAHPYLAPRSGCVGLWSFPAPADCSPRRLRSACSLCRGAVGRVSLLGPGSAGASVLFSLSLDDSRPALELQPLPGVGGLGLWGKEGALPDPCPNSPELRL